MKTYPRAVRETVRPYRVWDERANKGRGGNVPHRCYRWALNAHRFASADCLFGDGRMLTVYNCRDGKPKGTYTRGRNGGGVERHGYKREW